MGKIDAFPNVVVVTLLLTLTVFLARRKLARKFPLFLSYIILAILIELFRLLLLGDYQLYFKVYWATEALYAILALLALYEAFHDVFIIDYRDYSWFWMVFPGAVLVLTIVFAGYALLHPVAGASPIITLILSFETVVNCVKGWLFVMFLALAWLLMGERWPTYPYGVVLGFAVSTTGTLLSYRLFSIFGTKASWLGKYGPPVSYILAVAIWIGSCFLPPEPEDRWKNFTTTEEALATVRQYMKALRWIAGKR